MLTEFTRAGLTFDVVDEGPADAETVLLLHGAPQTAQSWSGVTPLLTAAGLRVVAPDQRGYSPRARPRGRLAYRLPALAEDVAALIASCGAERVHLVGHDWGAVVAWVLAMRRPDLVATLTALSVPHPGGFARALVSSRQAAKSWYMALFQLPWVPERLMTHAAVRARAVEFLVSTGQDRAAAVRDVARLADPAACAGMLGWYRASGLNLIGTLTGPVGAPTLQAWGARDAFVAERGFELSERYLTGPHRYERLPGVGHWIPDRHPDLVAELVLEQVRSHPAGRSAG